MWRRVLDVDVDSSVAVDVAVVPEDVGGASRTRKALVGAAAAAMNASGRQRRFTMIQ